MNLFGTIQIANTGLQASQLGLQTVSHNVSNAATPGYIRQRLELQTNAPTQYGQLLLGNGVRATGVTQVVDRELMERMLAAKSDVAAGQQLGQAFNNLENLVGQLDGGLRASLMQFNNSLHELSATPHDRALRDFVIQQGESLARQIQDTGSAARDLQNGINGNVGAIANTINEKLQGIAKLNVQIASLEGGGLITSDASGLREQRYQLLEGLADLVDIKISEQATGAISVFVGGDYLVSEGHYRAVEAGYDELNQRHELRIAQSQASLKATSGQYGAIVRARDEVFTGFMQDLDRMAAGLITAVNDIHSQGQGRSGFQSLQAATPATSGVPLRDAGLGSWPTSGAFEITLVDSAGAPLSHHQISITAAGAVGDTTLDNIVADLNAIDGLQASLSSTGQLQIQTTSGNTAFVFGRDTSGFLSAAGINTFFTGSGAGSIAVNPTLQQNSDYLAVSRNGIRNDASTLTELIDVINRPLESLGGRSVLDTFESSVLSLGQKISSQRGAAQGASDLYEMLTSQHLAISGVNVNEESLKMLMYNRAFQANAKVITTANEMLEVLLTL